MVAIEPTALIDLVAVCRTCKHQHRAPRVTPLEFSQEVLQWREKHLDHDFEFLTERRHLPRGLDDREYERTGEAPWYLDYKHNADLKVAYAASAAITIGLASLASSSTWLSGRESALQDNTLNKYIAGNVTARISTNGGSAPTADTLIRVYAYRIMNDTPVYPGGLVGSDANATITNKYVLNNLALLGTCAVSATTGVAYDFPAMLSLERAFDQHPKKWGIYVAHNTGQALHATAGNHIITYNGVYFTSI